MKNIEQFGSEYYTREITSIIRTYPGDEIISLAYNQILNWLETGTQNSEIVDNLLRPQYGERGQRNFEVAEATFLALSEGLLKLLPRFATYGVHAPAFIEGIRTLDNPKKILLLGATARLTMKEFSALNEAFHPNSKRIVGDIEDHPDLRGDENVVSEKVDALNIPRKLGKFDSIQTTLLFNGLRRNEDSYKKAILQIYSTLNAGGTGIFIERLNANGNIEEMEYDQHGNIIENKKSESLFEPFKLGRLKNFSNIEIRPAKQFNSRSLVDALFSLTPMELRTEAENITANDIMTRQTVLVLVRK